MSAADLEFSLPIINTVSSQTSSHDVTTVDHGESCVSTSDNEQECRTPKNMIPAILICPPAPRKPLRRRSATASCKRKLCDEQQFFEILAREEVESFFRRVEESINGKRRCVA